MAKKGAAGKPKKGKVGGGKRKSAPSKKTRGRSKAETSPKVGKGSGKAKALEAKGTKRKVEEASEQEKKGKKALTPKQTKRKEVTLLYSELINPGRTRKPEEVVKEILEVLSQRADLAEYCSKQLGARVVEACLKWGSRQQRQKLLSDFKEQLVKMAQDRYGHQVVLKLLLYSSRTSTDRKPTEEEKKAQSQNLRIILDKFQGRNLHTTFYNRFGCRVINGLYYSEAVPAKEKRRLLHDVAIPQAVALKRPELPGSKPLRQVLQAEDLTAQMRKDITQHLFEAAERSIEKELLGFDIVHLLFQALCEVASQDQLKELAEKCMAGAPYFLSSKPGAEALLRFLGVANAKQRKALCKDLKGKFADLAKNAVDYVVMIRVLMTVDDTVLVVKSMIAEFIEDIEEICFDKYGHKVLAWLLKPDDKHLFSPYERECVALPAPTSLKAPETRRQELVRAVKPALRGVFMKKPLEAAGDLHAKDLLAAYLAADWDAELLEALLAASEKEAAKKDFGLLDNGTATTSLIVLLKLEPEKGAKLGQPFWQRCLEPHLVTAAASRCAFVLLALLKGGGDLKETVLASLRTKQKALEKRAADMEASGGNASGLKKLLSEV
mmetsp:Transcript_56130/g.99946  ORF Transcript_56130/g.99946 Transcript_56130/m.99946 type:complete len:608 (+) Transcript_56130:38-1861(+)